MSEERDTLELSVVVGAASFSATGPTTVVLKAYADFKEFALTAPEPLEAKTPGRDKSASHPEQDDDAETSGAEVLPPAVKSPTSLPLKPYLARLKLRGNKEKITAIVAWSAESGEKAALTVAEIEKLWKKTPFKAPGNLTRDVRNAEVEGWLDSHGKAGSAGTTYSINGYGEGIVTGWIAPSEE